nr:hypothetical protein CFP56_59370 [Quercus suber]
MQLVGGLIDPEDVPANGADTVPNKHRQNRFDDIWNMPPRKKLFLQLNKAGQLVGKNVGTWARWMGTIARRHDMCPINYVSWHLVPQQYKNRYWEAIQAKYCKQGISKEALLELSLQENQSKDNKNRHGKQIELHMLGSKS